MTDPLHVLDILIGGLPIPGGSKSAYYNRATGQSRVVDANSKTLKPWRQHVQTVALAAVRSAGWQTVLAAPVAVTLRFSFPRPKSHPKGRTTWPTGHGSQGDVDKLARAVLDSFTDAKVWADDSQVVALAATKHWGEPGCAARVQVYDGGWSDLPLAQATFARPRT